VRVRRLSAVIWLMADEYAAVGATCGVRAIEVCGTGRWLKRDELFIRAFANLAVKFYVQAGYALQKPDRRAALQSFFELVVPLDYTARCATVIATRLTTELGDSSERLRGSLAEFFRILEELLCEALSVEGDGTQLSMSPGDAAKLLIATTRGIVVMRDMYLNPAPVMAVIKALLNAVVPSTADEQQIR